MSGYPIQSTSPVVTSLSIDQMYGRLSAEKSIFVFVNFLDIVFTFLLLESGSFYESNPIANFILERSGFAGMIVFKLIVTLFVIMIANYISLHREETSRKLLHAGTAIIGAVVVYSSMLLI